MLQDAPRNGAGGVGISSRNVFLNLADIARRLGQKAQSHKP
jgi:hypothetical protein